MTGYDRFLPIGKLIPPQKIPDPHNVRLQLQVNGKVVQDNNTNLMLFKIPELLEAITDVMSLRPCDIILSKFPARYTIGWLTISSGHSKGCWRGY
jgi:acylpyruvate hydrolase